MTDCELIVKWWNDAEATRRDAETSRAALGLRTFLHAASPGLARGLAAPG